MSNTDFQAALAATVQAFDIQHKNKKLERSLKFLNGTTYVPSQFEAYADL